MLCESDVPESRSLPLKEVNPHLICVLCGGYLIDATTIIECLHSFCRTCILRYLESSKFCPICDVLVHKTKPQQCVRSDQTLQTLVYKLVPGLFKEEYHRRKKFYSCHPEAGNGSKTVEQNIDMGLCPDMLDVDSSRPLTPDLGIADEPISLCLQHCEKLPPSKHRHPKHRLDNRYLLCPPSLTVRHLKKFLAMKYNLPSSFQVSIFHSNESLANSYCLLHIANIYSWRRTEPLRLFYTVWNGDLLSQQVVTNSIRRVVTMPWSPLHPHSSHKKKKKKKKKKRKHNTDSDRTDELSEKKLRKLAKEKSKNKQKKKSKEGDSSEQEKRGKKRRHGDDDERKAKKKKKKKNKDQEKGEKAKNKPDAEKSNSHPLPSEKCLADAEKPAGGEKTSTQQQPSVMNGDGRQADTAVMRDARGEILKIENNTASDKCSKDNQVADETKHRLASDDKTGSKSLGTPSQVASPNLSVNSKSKKLSIEDKNTEVKPNSAKDAAMDTDTKPDIKTADKSEGRGASETLKEKTVVDGGEEKNVDKLSVGLTGSGVAHGAIVSVVSPPGVVNGSDPPVAACSGDKTSSLPLAGSRVDTATPDTVKRHTPNMVCEKTVTDKSSSVSQQEVSSNKTRQSSRLLRITRTGALKKAKNTRKTGDTAVISPLRSPKRSRASESVADIRDKFSRLKKRLALPDMKFGLSSKHGGRQRRVFLLRSRKLKR